MPELHMKVLKILEKNAFTKADKIAQQLGISENEVEKIISELEKDKMILGYKAVINKEKAFQDKVFAEIEVSVTPERDEGFDKISERIYRFPEVRSLYLMSGNHDLMIFVEGNTLKEVAGFVSTKLSTIDRITHTTTHFMLKRYKEDGIILEETEKAERLKVAP